MKNLGEWIIEKKHVLSGDLQEEWDQLSNNLQENRDKYFKPHKFTINIRKGVPVYSIGDAVKEIAIPVKKNIKGNKKVYDILNKTFFRVLNTLEQNEEPKKTDMENLERFSCFLYFITVTKKFKKDDDQALKEFKRNHKKDNEDIKKEAIHTKIYSGGTDFVLSEKIVYVGLATDIVGRYNNGHSVTQKLNDPKWDVNLYEKKIYIATVEVNTEIEGIEVDLPLEILKPYELVKSILAFLESCFIVYFGVPEYNEQQKTAKINFPNWRGIPEVGEINLTKYNKSVLFGRDIKFDETKMIEIINSAREKMKSKKIKK